MQRELVTVFGAAGVGKSRLINELLAPSTARGARVTGAVPSYGEGITFWPLGEVVREAAGSATMTPSTTGSSEGNGVAPPDEPLRSWSEWRQPSA